MIKNYNSSFGQKIHDFIEMKKNLGFKFKTSAVILSLIDRMAIRTGESSIGITKVFADKWCEKQPNESDGYRYTRIMILAQFSSYLVDLGISSYLPKHPVYKKSTFIPYIYSPEEIEAIFKASDELKLHSITMNTSIFSMPALFRLLYSTGMRIGEALALKKNDILLEEQCILIKDSKSGKERIIPVSDSLINVINDYLLYREMLPLSGSVSEHFFIKLDGNKFNHACVGVWFRKCLERASITYQGQGSGPRIHDLRHTFAVTALAEMARAGIDLYDSLPVLSCYLGHQSLDSTNHYVRLTANMFPELIRDVDMISLDVFPKHRNYEAD